MLVGLELGQDSLEALLDDVLPGGTGAGDDHGAKSSTVPHQSDHAFIAALMPYLYPSSIHEIIEMGLLGIAMSRYSGCWVGMKVITETVETTAEIDLTDEMKSFIIPADFEMPPGGLNLRCLLGLIWYEY